MCEEALAIDPNYVSAWTELGWTHMMDVLCGWTVSVRESLDETQEAIEKAKSEKPDVIFLDILMPEMDGFEACRQLCNDGDTKDIPIVFVTSKSQKADRMWAQMQGGKALVTKPFTADDIIDQINEI